MQDRQGARDQRGAGRQGQTADLAVVRTQFATTYPNALRTWLQQQDRAVKLVRADKAAAAAAVGHQLNLNPAQAAEQIDELIPLDGKEQAAPGYLGTPERPGALAENLHSAAEFLKAQNKLPAVPALSASQKGSATKGLRDAFAG
ncbi:hypothetical protein [Nonomuraea sp. JJY05]|uniref:hypothetical protein n=1 Tax=Nonomuraea sp. JJY05 TaxID=3350255 RepID=UPI00373E7F8A